MSFDISSLSIVESTVLHLSHPANPDQKLYVDKSGALSVEKTDKPVTITVGSTSSRAYRAAVAKMQNTRLNRERQGKKVTAEQQKEEGLDLLTSVCLGSDNLIYLGDAVKTPADFRALLADDKMSWVKAQIDETLGAVELFIA